MEGSNIEVLQFLIDNNADLVAKNEVEKNNIANVNVNYSIEKFSVGRNYNFTNIFYKILRGRNDSSGLRGGF